MNERMADPLDEAAQLTAEITNAAIAAAARANEPESHPDFDGENCLDCDNPIPPRRLEMGKIRCVHCQSKIEQCQKMYARPNSWGSASQFGSSDNSAD